MVEAKIGIIGGSGLYKMDALKNVKEVTLDTPFGSPSDAFIIGTLEDTNFIETSKQKNTAAKTTFYQHLQKDTVPNDWSNLDG